MHAAPPDEERYVVQAIGGDAEAFGELYRLHADAIYRFILSRVGNPADAEDLRAQVFLKAWEALPGYEQRGSRFASWLFQIAQNLIVDYYRAQARSGPLLTTGAPSTQPDALDRVIAAEQSQEIASAVAGLPPDQRRVIVLRFFRNLDHGEVAHVLEKSRGACRVIQHRALTALQHMLASALLPVLLLLLLFGGGTVMAAERALPGEPLYPVKRWGEELRRASASGPGAARLALAFADRRLAESAALLALGRPDELPQALTAYTAELDTARLQAATGSAWRAEERAEVAALILAAQPRHAAQLATIEREATAGATALIDGAIAAGEAARDEAIVLQGGPVPPAPTATPTRSPTRTLSPSATASPRPSPSATSTPSATPLPVPSATPSAIPPAEPQPATPRPAPIPPPADDPPPEWPPYPPPELPELPDLPPVPTVQLPAELPDLPPIPTVQLPAELPDLPPIPTVQLPAELPDLPPIPTVQLPAELPDLPPIPTVQLPAEPPEPPEWPEPPEPPEWPEPPEPPEWPEHFPRP